MTRRSPGGRADGRGVLHFYSVLRYCIVSAAVSDLARGLGVGACNASGRDAFRPITGVNFKTELEWVHKEKKMKKIHKSVLRSSLVMLSLLALTVAGSSVAQAQECIARAGKSVMVRAEGITEVVGTIDLRCAEPMGVLGFGSPAMLEITVELNTSITNRHYGRSYDCRRHSGTHIHGLRSGQDGGNNTDATFSAPQGDTIQSKMTGTDDEAATLSEDGTTITWKILSQSQPGRRTMIPVFR